MRIRKSKNMKTKRNNISKKLRLLNNNKLRNTLSLMENRKINRKKNRNKSLRKIKRKNPKKNKKKNQRKR